MTQPPQPPQGPYPGQPYGDQNAPYFQPQPPKKKKWPWILGGIVLVFILLFAGCAALVGTAANEVVKESEREVTITYEVTTKGQPGVTAPVEGSITYANGDGNITQDTEASLPWTKDVVVTGLGKYVSLNVTAGSEGGTIVCTIRQGDNVISTNEANGAYASASCSGSANN